MYQTGSQLNNNNSSAYYGQTSFKERTMQANSSLYPNVNHYQRHTVEDALAREIQRMKQAEEAKALEIEKIYAESEELKLLKHKIKTAQVSKERTRQICEAQQRRIEDVRHEAELEDNLLRKCEEEKRIEGEKERIQLEWRLQGKYVLQEQMQEKKRAQEEAFQQYLLEKDQVDDIVQSIIKEDKLAIEEDKKKKKKSFQDMVLTLADKAERKANEKIHEQLENAKYKKFYEQKEQMQAQIKKKRADLEAHKAVIFDRLKKEEERRRKEKDLMDDLRMELYKEEFEAQERKKDREEKEKREQAKYEMMADERHHKLEKARIAEEERQLEMEFRQNMMQKYQEESRLDQLSALRKRQVELDHKEQVEKLWKERLEMYREIKEREQEEARRENELKSYKEELIRLEKERLLREYIDELAGFMPKGMLSNPEETKYLKNSNPQTVRTGYASNFKIY